MSEYTELSFLMIYHVNQEKHFKYRIDRGVAQSSEIITTIVKTGTVVTYTTKHRLKFQ